MDNSIDPCEDFYQFANGGWLATHPIPSDKGAYGSAQWIDERNKEVLKRILETPVEDLIPTLGEQTEAAKEADRQNLKDLNGFYTSCMDEDALDRMGSAPLVTVVEEVLSAWREKGDAMAFKTGDRQQRLTDTLLLLHSKGRPKSITRLLGCPSRSDKCRSFALNSSQASKHCSVPAYKAITIKILISCVYSSLRAVLDYRIPITTTTERFKKFTWRSSGVP